VVILMKYRYEYSCWNWIELNNNGHKKVVVRANNPIYAKKRALRLSGKKNASLRSIMEV